MAVFGAGGLVTQILSFIFRSKSVDKIGTYRLLRQSFRISQQLNATLKNEVDSLRNQVQLLSDTVNELAHENAKLHLEISRILTVNQKLMEENEQLRDCNEQHNFPLLSLQKDKP